MKRLIVNADDFGLHEAVNRGIQAAYLGGIVTSASLMAGGEAFADALRIANALPELGVGVHLTLVGGRPVSPCAEVSSLVDAEGRFYESYPLFLARYLRGAVRRKEIELELAAQIDKVRCAGINPTHLDSHQHLHVMPGISGLVLDLARRFSIRAVRTPAESALFFGSARPAPGRVLGRTGLTLLAGFLRQQAAYAGMRTTEHFFGMLSGGQLDEAALQAVLGSLPDGDSEIMTHPGAADNDLTANFPWGYHWGEELQALCSPAVRDRLAERKIRLISFREL